VSRVGLSLWCSGPSLVASLCVVGVMAVWPLVHPWHLGLSVWGRWPAGRDALWAWLAFALLSGGFWVRWDGMPHGWALADWPSGLPGGDALWADSGEGAHFAGLELAMPMGGAGLGLASCAGDGGDGHRESGAVWASGASSWLSEGGDGHGG